MKTTLGALLAISGMTLEGYDCVPIDRTVVVEKDEEVEGQWVLESAAFHSGSITVKDQSVEIDEAGEVEITDTNGEVFTFLALVMRPVTEEDLAAAAQPA